MTNNDFKAKLDNIISDLNPSKEWDKNENALNEIIV